MRTYANYGQYATGTYELRSVNSIKPKQETKVIATVTLAVEDRLRVAAQIHSPTTDRGDAESLRSSRGNSQDLIIRKEPTFAMART